MNRISTVELDPERAPVVKQIFHYGEFQYGNIWYKGTYEPLITKALFERVQIQLQVAPRQWNKQLFPFKKICICGSCDGSVTAELKYRRTKANIVNSHIYYHCNRIKKYDCPEPYITEQELIKQLIGYLPKIKLNTSYLMQEFEVEVKRLQHFKANVINDYIPRVEITPHNTGDQNPREYNETHTEIPPPCSSIRNSRRKAENSQRSELKIQSERQTT